MSQLDHRASLWPWLMLAIAAAAGVVAGRPGSHEVIPVVPAIQTIEAASITVHVSGWVFAPGLVVLPEGSRVADAVGAAGGVRPGGRFDQLNLARGVVDGERIDVPGPGEDAAEQPDMGKLRVNEADATALETLPGVGPVLAAQIVAYREKNGPFSVAEDLLDVPGIGEAKLDSIRDLISVP